MDDLLLFTPTKKSHVAKLEDPLKALLKNGLKISPKKCQLFRRELPHMGNTAFEVIKSRWQKPQVLHLPDSKGRFHLYSDTSKIATGSVLYQIQNGKP